jgi:DNA-binding NarL/FixJ family response regulator
MPAIGSAAIGLGSDGGIRSQNMARHHILIADDHPLFRAALKQTLADLPGRPILDEVGDLEAALRAIGRGHGFDLILLDLHMPGVQGLAGLAYLRAQYPHLPVAIVSASEDGGVIRRALDLGASGYIPKSTPVEGIKGAVSAILGGDSWSPPGLIDAPGEPEIDGLARRLASLTPSQMRVLMMLKEGLLNKQIAHALGISEATIKAHVSAILQKLDVGSRTQAVIAVNRLDGEASQGNG